MDADLAELLVDLVEAVREPSHPARRDPELGPILEIADLRMMRLWRRGGPSGARRAAVAEAIETLLAGRRPSLEAFSPGR